MRAESHGFGVFVVALALAAAGCRQDMHDQPKYKALRASTFFADGESARPLVEGTVARGELREDALLYAGKSGAAAAATLPFPVTRDVFARGRERYDIYCSPCHDRVGGGLGMVVRRGFRQPPSFHIDRLREAPVGYFFDVISNGFGVMPDYAAQVSVRDRWAIAAYVRALQLAERATPADVPPEELSRLESGEPGSRP